MASVLAGQLAAFVPAHFEVAGQWWTSIHILFLLSAVGRLLAAVLSLRLQDPGARGGVPELVRSLVEPLRAAAARSVMPDLVRLPAFARRRVAR